MIDTPGGEEIASSQRTHTFVMTNVLINSFRTATKKSTTSKDGFRIDDNCVRKSKLIALSSNRGSTS